MSGRFRFAAFLVVFAASVAVENAQSPQERPQFRAGIEYVEVDARVVDVNGEPIRDLTQRDFKVFEDGVPQDLKTFSIVDLPVRPATTASAASIGVKPDVATNVRPLARGRTYLIVFDAMLVAPCQTLIVRRLLREFIERSVDPDDRVAITSTGRDRSFENFTNDKSRLLAVVGSLMGQAEPSPTVAAGQPDLPIGGATTDDARQSQRRLVQVVQAMSVAGDGSKAIILVSGSIPFDLVTNSEGLSMEGLSLATDLQRLFTTVRRGNVPIYPVYPRGLTDGSDCESAGIPVGASSPTLLAEVRRQQDNLRVIADDSGGVPIVGTNDLAGGLQRIVRLSSFYYVVGYNSTNSRADGKYHRINVTVMRPEARVLARKGYTAPRLADAKKPSSLAGPPGSSTELREALNAALPVSDLPISITAAAFRQTNRRGASASVVLETLGTELAWGPNGALTAPIEMTAVALAPRGEIRSGDHGRVQFTQRTETSDKVRRLGFRWLARLNDLKPGRYQIRGAVSNGPGKQGSVWYNFEIPDFATPPLAMSDVLLASVAASQRPTLRPDTALAEALPVPATSVRDFISADRLALYAEVYDNALGSHDIETTVVVTNDRGEEAFHNSETHSSRERTAGNGTLQIKLSIPLAAFAPGHYTLTVEARQTSNRAIAPGRAVPFHVANGGAK